MKHVIVCVGVLALLIAPAAFAADPAKPNPKFEQVKEKHLQNLDAHIKKDQDLKVCYEKAQSPADMQVCRGKAPKGKGAGGPKFASNKTKALQQIDDRIKLREDRKACIAKAANHADMKACPMVRGGR